MNLLSLGLSHFYTVNIDLGCVLFSPRPIVRPSAGCRDSSEAIEFMNLLAAVADIFWLGHGKSSWDWAVVSLKLTFRLSSP